MVYVYKKTIGGKPYYYLRASERKGKRVIVKDIAYLGNSIGEVKIALDNPPFHKEKIRKAYKTIHRFLESNHYLENIRKDKLKKDPYLGDALAEIESCKLHFTTAFRKLPKETQQEIWKNFIIEFSFNTASIEGNTITLKQARDLLEEGKTPKNKALREIYDLQNSEKVFFELRQNEKPLTHDLIITIHAGLMENIDRRVGYRNEDVRVVRAAFKSTPAPYVKADMGILLRWYDEHKTKLHPLALAAIFHHKFEKIHPFMDGNGRAGRMLLNHILLANSYPPVIIHRKFRTEYLNGLQKADKSHLTKFSAEEYEALVRFISDEMVRHYWNIFL